MDVSIITPVYNDTRVRRCIESVRKQRTDFTLEHIVVDGMSTDETVDILRQYEDHIDTLVRESDSGIYDAMNKGIERATGAVVGILNADDRYQDEHVLRDVHNRLQETGAGTVYGDVVYVDETDTVSRYWSSGPFRRYNFYLGWAPPHPSFFVRRSLYEEYGRFDTDLPIAADYEFIFRLLMKHDVSTSYLNRVLVRMDSGGASNRSPQNMLQGACDIYRTWKRHGSKGRFIAPIAHPLQKLPQFIKRPPANVNHWSLR